MILSLLGAVALLLGGDGDFAADRVFGGKGRGAALGALFSSWPVVTGAAVPSTGADVDAVTGAGITATLFDVAATGPLVEIGGPAAGAVFELAGGATPLPSAPAAVPADSPWPAPRRTSRSTVRVASTPSKRPATSAPTHRRGNGRPASASAAVDIICATGVTAAPGDGCTGNVDEGVGTGVDVPDDVAASPRARIRRISVPPCVRDGTAPAAYCIVVWGEEAGSIRMISVPFGVETGAEIGRGDAHESIGT